MLKKYINLVYNVPNLRQPSIANVVVYQKGNLFTALIEESGENSGSSLTNSIEYAVEKLAGILKTQIGSIQVFQLDVERDSYDFVSMKNGTPHWKSFDNSVLVDMMVTWLGLSEEEEKEFTA